MKIIKLFELYKKQRLPSKASIKNYTSLINVFIRDTKVSHIHNINYDTIISWRDDILKRASITTWNTYLRQLRALFEFGCSFGHIKSNVFKSVKLIPVYKKKPKILSDNIDITSIDKYIKKTSFQNECWFWVIVVKMLYFTGIRRKQLIYLKWKDINYESKILKLSSQGSKTRREYFVPITDNLIADLITLYKNTKKIKPNIKINDQLFNVTLFNKNYRTKDMKEHHISHFFRKLSNTFHIKISAHMIRHTMATRIANKAHNIKPLQHLLGHTNINTTMIYIHTNMDEMRKLQKVL